MGVKNNLHNLKQQKNHFYNLHANLKIKEILAKNRVCIFQYADVQLYSFFYFNKTAPEQDQKSP